MNNYLDNIKQDLSNMSSEHIMITVKRSDIEQLVKAYEKLKADNEKLKGEQ